MKRRDGGRGMGADSELDQFNFWRARQLRDSIRTRQAPVFHRRHLETAGFTRVNTLPFVTIHLHNVNQNDSLGCLPPILIVEPSASKHNEHRHPHITIAYSLGIVDTYEEN